MSILLSDCSNWNAVVRDKMEGNTARKYEVGNWGKSPGNGKRYKLGYVRDCFKIMLCVSSVLHLYLFITPWAAHTVRLSES